VRAAERRLLERPEDAAAIAEFRRQTSGVIASLTDVFGDRFLRANLEAHQRRVLAEAAPAAGG